MKNACKRYEIMCSMVIIAFVVLIGLPVQVSAQMSKSQRAARIPTVQQVQDMVNQPKLNNMVLITNGQGGFMMGIPSNSPYSDDYNRSHRVTVNNFYLAIYPVTQAEYNAVMDNEHIRAQFLNTGERNGSHLPVENVSWYEAIEYCNRISRKERLTPVYTISGSTYYNNNTREPVVTRNSSANGYRLPTEAEWEYACRAGTTGNYSTGNSITESQAAFDAIGGGIFARQTHSKPVPVGSYRSNPWGLYDMHGNVWEWVWDWYGAFSGSNDSNPGGPAQGEFTRALNGDRGLQGREDMRVIRGGSWSFPARSLLSGYRNAMQPNIRLGRYQGNLDAPLGQIGFRIARNAN